MKHLLVKSVAAGIAGLTLSLPALAAEVVTKVQDLGTLSTPGQVSYLSSFNLLAPNRFSTSNGATLTGADRFWENYAFSIAPSTLASLTSTLSFANFIGIDDLQARLYRGDASTVLTGAAGPALVTAWGMSFDAGQVTVTNALITPTELVAGNYVLQIRGRVSGDFGGSYSGNITLSPIPEPQTYALLLAGLLTLTTLHRRGRRSD